jgi:aspartyl-tRNA(Asn)/glutamyl-tRNA(Gln) amidotransferase subunit C
LPAHRNGGTTEVAMADTKISPEQVRRVAKLSRLALNEDELARFGAQLGSILGYVAQIERADVTGVEPMAHAADLKNVLRDDVVEGQLPIDKVLQNAPETDGPFFKVPKVIGGDEDSAG